MKLRMLIALAIATTIYVSVPYGVFAAERKNSALQRTAEQTEQENFAGIKKQIMAAYIFDLIDTNANLQAERIMLTKKNQELQGQINAQKKPAADEDKP